VAKRRGALERAAAALVRDRTHNLPLSPNSFLQLRRIGVPPSGAVFVSCRFHVELAQPMAEFEVGIVQSAPLLHGYGAGASASAMRSISVRTSNRSMRSQESCRHTWGQLALA
jgi:hypothetical protein